MMAEHVWGDEDDDDNLEDILQALGPEILQKSLKGLKIWKG
jgi:hypothetical protein